MATETSSRTSSHAEQVIIIIWQRRRSPSGAVFYAINWFLVEGMNQIDGRGFPLAKFLVKKKGHNAPKGHDATAGTEYMKRGIFPSS